MVIYITADPHYSNTNIIKHTNRPYLDKNEMDYDFIRIHNKVISKDDTYVCVGDWCLYSNWNRLRHKSILSMLNGKKKILISGNHDGTATKMKALGFDLVYPRWRMDDVIFIHKPQDAVKMQHTKGKIIITGHCHNATTRFYKLKGHKIVNIGVDLWNYEPVCLSRIREEYKSAIFPDLTEQFDKYEKRRKETK